MQIYFGTGMLCRTMSSVRTRSTVSEIQQPAGGKMRCTVCRWSCEIYTESELSEHLQRDHPSCLSCGAGLSKYHRGIKCPNNHHLCKVGCSTNYINSQLSEMIVPFKCSICSIAIPITQVKPHLSEKQRLQYANSLAGKHSVSQEDTALQCQNIVCGKSIEHVFPESSDQVMIPCDSCAYSTCFICFRAIDTTRQGMTAQHKIRCGEILKIKREFEQAVANGTSFKCPRCQRGGRKDDGCNYIHCAGCPAVWCYLCGLEETSAQHQCVLPRTHVALPSSFKGSLVDRLHHSRTVLLLHELYGQYGAAKMRTLWDRFESVRAHGYTFEEISQTNLL